MERKVALKILSPALTNNPEFVDRFMAEVKMSAKLHHPNIVTAFDAGNENGIYYLAISYVDGAELDDRLKIDKFIPEKEALVYIRNIAEALKYAWNKFQILHRDIKPSNIMVDSDNEAKLMDMGISKSLADDLGLTMTGMVIGTPYYMSPEQAKAEQTLDFRADLYSLGATLYHLVTGHVPYDSTTAMGILTKHITEPFPSPKEKNPELSDECIVLLEIMMAKKKEDRQASWEDVIRDINLVLEHKLPASPLPQGASTISATISRNHLNFPQAAQGDSPHMAKFHNEGQNQSSSGGMRTGIFLVLSVAVVIILGGLAYLISSKLSDSSISAMEKVFEKKKKELGLGSKKEAGEEEPSKPSQIVDYGREEVKPGKVYDERNMREMWDLSVSFFDKNPEMFEMAIENFSKIKKSYPGTKYAIKADLKIKELRDLEKKFKKEKAKAVIEDLKAKAKDFAARKEFVKAAEIFRSYTGKYESETRDDREICAEDFIQKARELEEKKEQARLLAEKRKEDFLNSVSEDVLKGKFDSAYETAEKSKESGCVKGLKKTLKDLAGSDEIIVKSLKKDVGKNIVLDLPKGKESGKIKRIKNGCVYYMTKMGRGYIQKKIPIKNLPVNEKLRRLESMDKNAKKLYSISLAVRLKKFFRVFVH
jgi:serine/threonine protein kinase